MTRRARTRRAALVSLVALVAVAGGLEPSGPEPSHRRRVIGLRSADQALRVSATTTANRAVNARACAGRARAVSHRAGGVAVAARSVPLGPIPCLYRTGAPSWEPTIGVTGRGWVFEGGDGASHVRAGQVGVGGILVSVVRSKDGGRSWEDVSPPDVPSPVGDPFLHLDGATGRLFVAQFKLLGGCYQLWWSDDHGDSWSTNPAVCGLADHENIFTAPPTASVTAAYPNVVYMCATEGGLGTASLTSACLKSVDGGRSFVPAGSPPFPPTPERGDGGLGQGLGAPDGTIYLPKGWNGRPYLAVSRDEGLSWQRHLVADSGLPHEPHVTTLSDVAWAHQAGVARDSAGNLYYTWVDEDRRPMLAISRNGGRRWSKPINVGPPGLALASLPVIDVGRPGAVAVAYMGFPQTLRGWNGYITVSTNVLSPNPLFYTAPVNDPRDPLVLYGCGVIRCQDAGDFFDIAIGPDGTPWVSFVDACSPKCVRQRDHDLAEGVVGRLTGIRLR